MTKQDILNEVANSKWQPEFEFTDSIYDVVDSILKPHEDYGLGLHSELIKILEEEKETDFISFDKACKYQKRLFNHKLSLITAEYAWLPNLYIDLGIRNTDVIVGNWIPPKHYSIWNLIDMCFPISTGQWHMISNHNEILKNLTQWFKVFQTIHPFNDLNGRVGGLIINIISYNLTGKYLISKEYNK